MYMQYIRGVVSYAQWKEILLGIIKRCPFQKMKCSLVTWDLHVADFVCPH